MPPDTDVGHPPSAVVARPAQQFCVRCGMRVTPGTGRFDDATGTRFGRTFLDRDARAHWICHICTDYDLRPCGDHEALQFGYHDDGADDTLRCVGCLLADGFSRCENYGCRSWIVEGQYCGPCDEHIQVGELIKCYSYKPAPAFRGEGPLYLGVELEIDTPYDGRGRAARVAQNHLGGLGYLKDDSSISDGFEIVTHPMSHAWAREHFPLSMLDDLSSMGCDAESNGLHVHVSRAGFDSPVHVYRWLKLLYRNAADVTDIARRTSNDWAPWRSEDRRYAKHWSKREHPRDCYGYQLYSPSRYAAVNVTNEDTFEVRVFAGTLDRQSFLAALDLVAGSVEYTRDLSVRQIVSNDGWGWGSFLSWASTRPEYVALAMEADELCAC